ncbi:unnamed protein product [Haemonchus placei]|uniref:Uncharacterized protein n=1 Tax=Haemonchus placei TaxID=6290 RepID=A0A0N4WC12_HAEPC|nr:unnamed protein product [Haemonchus placei]
MKEVAKGSAIDRCALPERFYRDHLQKENGFPAFSDGLPDFGGIRDYVPGAKENFGIRKGPGCLPFLSEVMQVAYGNCQQVADEKAFDAWGDELKSAILTGKIDLLKASQETCRRGAERQQCGALRRAISNCDILESLQIGAQLQRAMKRCEEVSGLVDQNPLVILSQINRLVGGEFAQGFLNKMVLLLYAFLTFTLVSSAPIVTVLPTTTGLPSTTTTTVLQTTSVRLSSIAPPQPVIATSTSTESTNLSNDTEATYTGLRGSIQREIIYLRESYETLRKEFDDWMNTPYHRNVVVPAAIGVVSAFISLILFYFVKGSCRRCMRRFRRTRLSHMTCELNGDKKRMLPRKGDTDDDDL